MPFLQYGIVPESSDGLHTKVTPLQSGYGILASIAGSSKLGVLETSATLDKEEGDTRRIVRKSISRQCRNRMSSLDEAGKACFLSPVAILESKGIYLQ